MRRLLVIILCLVFIASFNVTFTENPDYIITEQEILVFSPDANDIHGCVTIDGLETIDHTKIDIDVIDPITKETILYKGDWEQVGLRLENNGVNVDFYFNIRKDIEIESEKNYEVVIKGQSEIKFTMFATRKPIINSAWVVGYNTSERVYHLKGSQLGDLTQHQVEVYHPDGSFKGIYPITKVDYMDDQFLVSIPTDTNDSSYRFIVQDAYLERIYSNYMSDNNQRTTFGLMKSDLDGNMCKFTLVSNNTDIDNIDKIELRKDDKTIDLLNYTYESYQDDLLIGYTFQIPLTEIDTGYYGIKVYFKNGNVHGTSFILNLMQIHQNSHIAFPTKNNRIDTSIWVRNLGVTSTQDISLEIIDPILNQNIVDYSKEHNIQLFDQKDAFSIDFIYEIIKGYNLVNNREYILNLKTPYGKLSHMMIATSDPLIDGADLVAEKSNERMYWLLGNQMDDLIDKEVKIYHSDGSLYKTTKINQLNYNQEPFVFTFIAENDHVNYTYYIDDTKFKEVSSNSLHASLTRQSMGLTKYEVKDNEVLISVSGINYDKDQLNSIMFSRGALDEAIDLLDYKNVIYKDDIIEGYTFSLPKSLIKTGSYLIESFFKAGQRHGTSMWINMPKAFSIHENSDLVFKLNNRRISSTLWVNGLNTSNTEDVEIDVLDPDTGTSVIDFDNNPYIEIRGQNNADAIYFNLSFKDNYQLEVDKIYLVRLSGPNGTLVHKMLATNKPLLATTHQITNGDTEVMYHLIGYDLPDLTGRIVYVYTEDNNLYCSSIIENIAYNHKPNVFSIPKPAGNASFRVEVEGLAYQRIQSNQTYYSENSISQGLTKYELKNGKLYVTVTGLNYTLNNIDEIKFENDRLGIYENLMNYPREEYSDGDINGYTFILPERYALTGGYFLATHFTNGHQHGTSMYIKGYDPEFYRAWEQYGQQKYVDITDPWLKEEILKHIGEMSSEDLLVAENTFGRIDQVEFSKRFRVGLDTVEKKVAFLDYLEQEGFTAEEISAFISILNKYDFASEYFFNGSQN